MRCTTLFLLILIGALSCCGGEKTSGQSKTPQKQSSNHLDESHEKLDTAWEEEIVITHRSRGTLEIDTSFMIDGELHYLNFCSTPLDEEVSYLNAWERNGEIHAQKLIGKNRKYSFKLYDSQDYVVGSSNFDKNDLLEINYDGLIVESDGYLWQFQGYLKEFDMILFDAAFMIDDSDAGIDDLVFFDKTGEIKHLIPNRYMGGGGCDFDHTYQPSEDGETLCYCSRIQKSDGSFVELEDDEFEVTGSFILNNEHVLVIHTYQGKPPYNNAKIMSRDGEVLKTFDYEGTVEELGYTIPKFYDENNDFLYLVDGVKKCLFKIDVTTPTIIEQLYFENMKQVMASELTDDQIITTYGLIEFFNFYLNQGDVYIVRD